MAPDVLSGHVDAATMDAAGNEATGNAQFRTLGSTFDAIAPRFLASLWFSSTEFVTKNPAAAKTFATIVRQASAWANANPHDAIAIYAKNSKYAVADLEHALRPIFATSVTPELVQPSIDAAAKYGMIKASFPRKTSSPYSEGAQPSPWLTIAHTKISRSKFAMESAGRCSTGPRSATR